METDSIQAHLNSLRKLYGLLQINNSGEQREVSEILDEGSRLFLRKLLDGAAERVFEAYIKIMADGWRNLLGTKSLGQLEEAKESEMLQYAAKSPNFDQNITESVGALLLKDDQSTKMTNRIPSVTSLVRRFTSELQSRGKKCYLACEQSSKLEETNKTIACSANRTTPMKEVENKASKVEDFSKKVDDAIARIESLIPSLHCLSKHVIVATGKNLGNPHSFRKTTSVLDSDAVGSSLGQTGGVVTKIKQSETRQSNQVQYRKSVFPEKYCPTKHQGKYASRKKASSQESSYRRPHHSYLPRFNESEETSSNSLGSSSSTIVEASSSSSPSDTRTTTSCSGENESEFSGNSLDYPDADFESGRTRYVMGQSSYRYDSSSNSASDSRDDDSSPSEDYQSRHHSVRHKKEGKFKRLKNKLGLIHHHHPHDKSHHHHPHDKSGEASGSVWSKVGKMFRRTDTKVEAKVGKKLKNTKKKDRAKNPKRDGSGRKDKKQIGHFHALLGGLMRHVRHSKKPKLGGQRSKKPKNMLNRVKVSHNPWIKLLGRKKQPRLRQN